MDLADLKAKAEAATKDAASYASFWRDNDITVNLILSLIERVERADIQLAGCSVAALGWDKGTKPDDYGWSGSLEDVLKLRAKLEAMQDEMDRVREASWQGAQHKDGMHDEISDLKAKLSRADTVVKASERLLLYLELHKQQRPGWNGNRFDDEFGFRNALADYREGR